MDHNPPKKSHWSYIKFHQQLNPENKQLLSEVDKNRQCYLQINPQDNITYLMGTPILLVYSRRDLVAPPEHSQAMREAAPHARFVESKKASHVMLTLIPKVNYQVARWLSEQLLR